MNGVCTDLPAGGVKCTCNKGYVGDYCDNCNKIFINLH